MIITDILSFAISDFSNTFIKATNQDTISLKIQFILGSLAKKDPGFTFNLTHDRYIVKIYIHNFIREMIIYSMRKMYYNNLLHDN